MVRGGKRAGAGRPKSEPTTQVRVPERARDAARSLAEHFLGLVDEAFRERHSEIIRRNGYEPLIRLVGIERIATSSIMAGRGTTTVLVATADMGDIKTVFEVLLDGSGYYSRSEEAINSHAPA